MSNDIKRGGGKQVCYSPKGLSFSTESYFSLRKHAENCQKRLQLEALVKYVPVCNDVDQTQELQSIAGAKEQVIVENGEQ